MDRLLRRKSNKPTPDLTLYSPRSPSYYSYQENAEKTTPKSPEAVSAAAQTIRSLENTYNRQSVTSFPPKPAPASQNEVKPRPNSRYSNQEHTRRGSRASRSASYSSETAASVNSRISRQTSESAAQQHKGVYTPESSVHAQAFSDPTYETSRQSFRSDEVEQQEIPNQTSPHPTLERTSERFPSARTSLHGHSPRHPVSPDSTLRESFLKSQESISSPNQDPAGFWWRPRTPKRDDLIDTSGLAGQITQKSTTLFATSPEPDGSENDNDDLSSVCSEDSYFQKEREKYYSAKMDEAIAAENWKEAKENAAKLIAMHREGTGELNTEYERYHTYAAIHYMLGELKETLDWLAKVPRKRSTHPNFLIRAFNMEAAIAFRSGEHDHALSLSKRAASYARKFQNTEELNDANYLSHLVWTTKGDAREASFYLQMVPLGYKPLGYYLKLLQTTSMSHITTTEGPGIVGKAIADFEGVESDELDFPEGATITDIEFVNDNWWSGQYNGRRGMFHCENVDLVLPDPPNERQSDDKSNQSNRNSNRAPPLLEQRDVRSLYDLSPPPSPEPIPKSVPTLGAGLFEKAGLQPGLGEMEYQGSASEWENAITLAINADEDTESARYIYGSAHINLIMLNGFDPLGYAIHYHKAHATLAILDAGKAIIYSPDFAMQPIQRAAESGNFHAVWKLLDAGADPDATGLEASVTALGLAARYGYYHICKILLDLGAGPLYAAPGWEQDRGKRKARGQASAFEIALVESDMPIRKKLVRYMLSTLKTRTQYQVIKAYLIELMTTKEYPGLQGIQSEKFVIRGEFKNTAIELLTEYIKNWEKAPKLVG